MELHRVTVTPLKSNCYILKSGTDITVVDPGGDPEKILEQLAKLDGQVKFIIATHYHFDHVGALKELK
ncbi:MAG TPA: MBL fold metallo-hydrolase, partial [Coprothermobacter proteolyticus]|nr:MBL fold metallo-hydrolase [Coprothermobacter proteolyticus]